jgi:hypothetical protein
MSVIITATELFPRNGVRGIQIAFKDTDLSAVTPASIAWTLTNRPSSGIVPSVVNSRDAVAVTPASTVTIVLSGSDLDFLTPEAGSPQVDRALLVSWTYNSATLGTAVTDMFQYNFQISNFSHLTV